MNTTADITSDRKNESAAHEAPALQAGSKALSFVDNKPEAIAQRRMQNVINNSAQAKRIGTFQAMANGNMPKTAQRQENVEEETVQGKFESVQREVNSFAEAPAGNNLSIAEEIPLGGMTIQSCGAIQRNIIRITNYADKNQDWKRHMEIIDSLNTSSYVHLSRSFVTDAQTQQYNPHSSLIEKSKITGLEYYKSTGKGTSGAYKAEGLSGADISTAMLGYKVDENAHITLEGRYAEVLSYLADSLEDTRKDKLNGAVKADRFDNIGFKVVPSQAGASSSSSSSPWVGKSLQWVIDNTWSETYEKLMQRPQSEARDQALIAAADICRVTCETAKDFAKAPAFKISKTNTPATLDELIYYGGTAW